MHDALKKICKGLEKEMEEYAQHMSDGRHQMHEKDIERLKNLGMAMASMKCLKMLEGMKDDGEQQKGHGIGQVMESMKKQGFGDMMNAISIPKIPGFSDNMTGNYPHIESPGPDMRRRRTRSEYDMDDYDNYDNYGEYDDGMEMRRGVPGTGRRRRRYARSEYEGNMAYNEGNTGGQGTGGNQGGQKGNTGGTGNR